MGLYRKKPIMVEAVQYTGENKNEITTFCRKHLYTVDEDLIIQTLEGNMHINPLDYVIKGVHGEFYPCKPDIFQKTYDEVEDVIG